MTDASGGVPRRPSSLQEWKALGGLGPIAAAEFVRDFWAAPGFGTADLDEADGIATGLMLSSASHSVAAGAVLDRLDADPTPFGLELACGLLRGLWSRPDTGQCTDGRVTRLLDLHDRIEPSAPVEFGFACALFRAAGCSAGHTPPVRTRLRAAFQACTGRLPGHLGDRLGTLFNDGDILLTLGDWRARRPLLQDDAAIFQELSPTATSLFIEEVCERSARAVPEYDSELLIRIGATLPLRSPAAGDAVLDWLGTAPTPERMEVACVLLEPLWRRGEHEDLGSCAVRLTDLHRGMEADPAADFAFAGALGAVLFGEDAVDERVRTTYLDTLGRLPENARQMHRKRYAAHDGPDAAGSAHDEPLSFLQTWQRRLGRR